MGSQELTIHGLRVQSVSAAATVSVPFASMGPNLNEDQRRRRRSSFPLDLAGRPEGSPEASAAVARENSQLGQLVAFESASRADLQVRQLPDKVAQEQWCNLLSQKGLSWLWSRKGGGAR